MILQLLCTVRGCAQPLSAAGKHWVCARGHSFDVARSGYVNLLQPQDRRSRQPGDSREAVAARRRFLDRGFGEPLLRGIVDFAASANTILDVGCGEGYHLNGFAGEKHGVDISVPAIDAAARRYRDAHFIVTNADRFLPYADHSIDLVTSITSRINAPEFARVVSRDGRVLVALPAPDDLIELRAAILGEGKQIDRTARVIDEMRAHFTLEKQSRVAHVAHLDAAAIHDVMASSYRGMRARQKDKMEAIGGMDVTLSRDLLLFRRLN